MRKDAERNRESLISAASAMMRSEGADVPMEIIAERAGTTRGTLYRNFPHRQAMYEAVLGKDLREVAERISDTFDEEPLRFIREMTELMMIYDKFLISLASMPDYDANKNQGRMVEVIAEPLAAAHKAGLLDPEITGDDILMVCRMLASHWRLDGEPDLESVFEKRFTRIMKGMGPK